MGIEKLKKEDYLKLYEFSLAEEDRFCEAQHKRVNFFSGFLSAIFLGAITGFFTAKNWYEYLLICFGPILAIIIASISIPATRRFYRRFLEAITFRAKIEYILGFDIPIPLLNINKKEKSQKWYATESLLQLRHKDDRDKVNSSLEFIKIGEQRAYQKYTERIFTGYIILSELLIFFALFMSIRNSGSIKLFFPNISITNGVDGAIIYDSKIAYFTWILLFLYLIVFLALWIWTLIACIKRDNKRFRINKQRGKRIWLYLLVGSFFLGLFWAISTLYFFEYMQYDIIERSERR